MPNKSTDSRLNRPLAIIVIVATMIAAAAMYAPRLHDFFVSDDFVYMRAFGESASPTGGAKWHSVILGDSDFLYRPVFGISGWLFYLLVGPNPLGWHLANLILHLLAVWLTIVLVRRFVTTPWAAICAGALFALHYLDAESVVWISDSSTLMVTVLMLASVALETRRREHRWGPGRWLALLLAVAAHLAKENAIALPLLLLLVPQTPVDLDEPRTARIGSQARSIWSRLWKRAGLIWPYIAITVLYTLSRYNAIATSIHASSYRLELGANVLKNFAFVAVSSLFPLDFRAALQAWNGWYLHGEFGALTEFILGSPGVIVGALVAMGIWCSIFLWGHRSAKRLAAWVFVAALPVLFFRGTGERLVYTSLPGAAGAIAITLAVWHRSFVAAFQRVGRWISPSLAIILLALHVGWLTDKLRDWQSAAELSRTIVTALTEIAPGIKPGATVGFTGLPDNINGAWVFRTGIDHAFALYAGRPDVHAVPATPGSPNDWDSTVVVYRWNGENFQITTDATPDARTVPQSAEP